MTTRITPRRFNGTVTIPASKSHTIRQLLIAALADGKSIIRQPLDSDDTRSCIAACKTFGAEITSREEKDGTISLHVQGVNGFKNSALKDAKIDAGNSGTTLFFALAIAGLQESPIFFTGDEQIQRRSAAPLLDALAGLGVQSKSNNGCTPITIHGGWKGGRVSLSCPTSQYLSALLIAAPLAPAGVVTEIDVPLLNEKPYVEMTLSYLKNNLQSASEKKSDAAEIKIAPDFSHFVIPGGSSWKAFSGSVPGDFSSAAFPAAAAAITGGRVTILGLDPEDSQGDKFFFDMLKSMGCDVVWNNVDGARQVTVYRDRTLHGGTFDLNATPDLLPAAAVTAAFAEGDTALVNVAHARIKETDRVAVMAKELSKLGVDCTERPDGLIIHGKGGLPPGGFVHVIEGHGDHRIAMAFAVAALGSPVPIEITTAECTEVTYPGFWEMVNGTAAS
ncbi:MAG: 3-phosphoshikimate 1-carboxyvinyltransferase [Treponema sp.]|nr:3-phosphoshikimate 1-carboxyvinyltransferase [Treponema sp.]